MKAVAGSTGFAEVIRQLQPQEHSEAALDQVCEQRALDRGS